jgi:hypothetical protein
MDDGDHPVTPLTGPTLDAEGRLTYIGEDGRRYVVVEGVELDAEGSARVMEALQAAGPLFQEIEALCHGWLERVSLAPLQRQEAIALLLATLETVLEVADNDDDTIDDDTIADGNGAGDS